MSADRQMGDCIGRIPFQAIDRFADRYGIRDLDAFDRFRAIIRAMDDEFGIFHANRPKAGQTKTEEADGVKGILRRLAKKSGKDRSR